MFEEVLQGRYEDWRGLLPRPTLEQLVQMLAPAALGVTRERNRISTRYRVTRIERPGPPTRFECWVRADEQVVTIIECNDPVCPDIEATLQANGKPEITLEDQRLRGGYQISEFVYPQRGVVLSIGTPTASAPGVRRSLLHARLFSPTTLQRYLTEIGEPTPALPSF